MAKQKTATQAVDFTSTTALEALTQEINELEAQQEAMEAKAEPFLTKAETAKERVKELRSTLAQAMITQNRHNVFQGGYQFTLKHNPPSFEVVNEQLARAWAEKNDCLRIDTTKAKTLLKREILTPGGFVRSDSVTVSRAQEKAKESE